MHRTHLKRQQLLLVMQLFLSCRCVSLFGKLHVYVLFLKKNQTKNQNKLLFFPTVFAFSLEIQ